MFEGLLHLNDERATGWACPVCGTSNHVHGDGGAAVCRSLRAFLDRRWRDAAYAADIDPTPLEDPDLCGGLWCDCGAGRSRWGSAILHVGWPFDPCPKARCAHCGWSGRLVPRQRQRMVA